MDLSKNADILQLVGRVTFVRTHYPNYLVGSVCSVKKMLE
jgi:hypothetical protein